MSKDIFYQVREEEVAHLITEVEEGNTRALKTYAQLKKCAELFTEAYKQIEPLAQNEASDYADKTFSENGFIFEKRNGATRYSYNHIPEVFVLKQKLKETEAKYKHAFLSTQKGLMPISEDGEELMLPKVSYSKDSLIVKKS